MYNTIGIDFVGFVCTHNSQKLYTNIKNIVIFFIYLSNLMMKSNNTHDIDYI